MAYKLKKKLANRKNYGGGRKTSAVKYIVIHYTANDGDTDEGNGNYFQNNIVKASAHYFVDSDSVTQSVPDDYTAYSVGGSKYSNCKTTGGGKFYGKCTNSNSISIELCDDRKDKKIYPTENTIRIALELTKDLMKKYGVPAENVIRHFDVNGKSCPAYWCGTDERDKKWKSEFWDKLSSGAEDGTGTNAGVGAVISKALKASDLKNMNVADIIKKVGPFFTADQKKTGVLASVSLAQFILESDYGRSELAQAANNCFGMKRNLSGNSWPDSAWDGKSVYKKPTKEHVDGKYITVTAEFRKYPDIAKSIADHSAYLLGAMNGKKKRYAGIKGETSYKKAITVIKDGGYATSPDYIEKICSLIKKYDLTKYDVSGSSTSAGSQTPSGSDQTSGTSTGSSSSGSAGCYKKYTGKSERIDEVFKAIGVPAKFRGAYMKRKPVASKNGISNYKGSKTQNLKLVKLAKTGKLKKV